MSAVTDSDMLTWLIKQGPPGANDHGLGLTEETWDSACALVSEERKTDQETVRELLRECVEEDRERGRVKWWKKDPKAVEAVEYLLGIGFNSQEYAEADIEENGDPSDE